MEENEKIMAALGEGAAQDGGDAGLRAALESAKHTSDVWAGRAKKLAEEKASMEAELRRLRSENAAKEVVDRLDEDDLQGAPREFVEVGGRVAADLVGKSEEKTSEDIRRLREEIAERDRSAFLRQISAQNGRFFGEVAPGGEKSAMWEAFKANNRETFAAVMDTRDVARFNRLVDSFYREIGVPNPSGGQGAVAAPDPRSVVGGVVGGFGASEDGRTYSAQEYLAALEKAEGDFRATGDRKSYDAATAALNRALSEGRVK